jgi:hypothetical protein
MFLEYSAFMGYMLTVERLESQIILKSFGSKKTKGP